MIEQLNGDNYFIVSSSCTITRGKNQSALVDYATGTLQVISNQYHDLLQAINRNKFTEIYSAVNEDSHSYLKDFLKFMISNNYAFIADNLDHFPIKDNNYEEGKSDHSKKCFDIILEVEEETLSLQEYIDIIGQLNQLECDNFQLRIYKLKTHAFLTDILEYIETTNFRYVELIFDSMSNLTNDDFMAITTKVAVITNVFIFSAGKNEVRKNMKSDRGFIPVSVGSVYFIEGEYNINNCGIITKDNLSVSNQYMHTIMKKFNGCLYKKLSVDTKGFIKNCPSMSVSFGNVLDDKLEEVYNGKSFKEIWSITKDQIETCSICEFRDICTDCRAFTVKPEDIYSKPSKCQYDPYTSKWNN